MPLDVGQQVQFVIERNPSWGMLERIQNEKKLAVSAIVTGFDEQGRPNLDLLTSAGMTFGHASGCNASRIIMEQNGTNNE